MKQKDFLKILIPLFLLTILWVIFNIYHSYVTSTIEESLTIQIIPIEGKFNNEAVTKIRDRQRIDPLFQTLSEVEISDEIASDSAEEELTLPEEISL